MRWVIAFLMPMLSMFGANILPHLKYIGPLAQQKQIEHIDCIYLINLDSRPEKLRLCMRELGRHKIVPYRFSAVIGKELSEDTIQDVGMKYKEGMMLCEGKFTLGPAARAFFHERMYGKVCFYRDFTKGALGCTLSHLSILQHAYESGYETIWVMEDDVIVQKDPRILSRYIEALDVWMGEENWDVLHTDNIDYNISFGDRWRPDYIQIAEEYLMEHPEQCEIYTSLGDVHAAPEQKINSWWIKRLKKAITNYGMIRPYPDLHEDFRYISGRFFTHSMIIRRSGMKKILDFEQRYGIFLPYDDEISVIPFLKMFNLKSSIVTKTLEEISDTLND